MIIACGGIKGGVGKTTIAVNLAIMLADRGRETLLVDADEQGTASDFTAVRNARLGEAGYTAVKLQGAAVRNEIPRLAKKYEDVVIDVGGRETVGQRAALIVADILLAPIVPSSFDVWSLERVAALVVEARGFNPKLRACCFLNRADPKGKDNEEAAKLAREIEGLEFIDVALGHRKVYRNSTGQGLGVAESRPADPKAREEMAKLFRLVLEAAKSTKKSRKSS